MTLAFFIRFADKVEIRVVLTSEHEPLRILAPAAIRIDSVLVGDGQQVQAGLPLVAYPWQEFGSLEATLRSISALPNNGYYNLELSFPAGLTTKTERLIPFREELPGVAVLHTASAPCWSAWYTG